MGLGEAASKRKERLAALKKQVLQGEAESNHSTNGTRDTNDCDTSKRQRLDSDDATVLADTASVPLLRFRNYQPDAETLQDFVEPAPLIGPDAKGHVDTVEGQVETIKKDALEAEIVRSKELDLTNLAPKKPNWDLKRDLDKKLDKLERRTRVAMADLIRERLKANRDVSLAAGAAEAGIHPTNKGTKDDDDDDDDDE
ncbi:hypothetical protein BASA62_010202 [Batrachochytrium salamandrivorans]|nr:hypothetical protein BASA62_010202 [Batrachochytrium salamandrivorans]